MYANNERLRSYKELASADSERSMLEGVRIFEPCSYIPDLNMLVQIFPFDRRLPALPRYASPTADVVRAMARMSGMAEDARIRAVEPVRYRSGLGAVMRYVLEDDRRRLPLYVKLFRDDGAHGAHEISVALRRNADADGLNVARSLGYLPADDVLVQAEAPGTPLGAIVREGPGARGTVRRFGRALAAFQARPVAELPVHGLAQELPQIERAGRMLAWTRPESAPEVEKIVEEIERRLDDVPGQPTHRDLKTGHVLVAGDRFTLVDLDWFAAADPVMDVATLTAELRSWRLRRSPLDRDAGPRAGSVLLDAYLGSVPPSWAARFPSLYAAALLKTAAGFFRRQDYAWPQAIDSLVDQAGVALQGVAP